MEKVAAVSLLSVLLYYLTSAQQENCGSIGNSNEVASTPSRAQLFYLNTANAAPCSGNITSWRVCYYGPDNVNTVGSYWTTYAVYRSTGSGSNIRYVRVSEMFRAIRTIAGFTFTPGVDGEIAQGGLNCYTDSIDIGDSPLTIQAGDILGACVFDPDGDIVFENDNNILIRLPLDVVGEASGPEESLLQMSTDGCSRVEIPSDIPTNQLSTLDSRRLHIYANIRGEFTSTTQVASTPPLTSTAATSTATVPPVTTVVDRATAAQTTATSTVIAANPLTMKTPSQMPDATITTTASTSITIATNSPISRSTIAATAPSFTIETIESIQRPTTTAFSTTTSDIEDMTTLIPNIDGSRPPQVIVGIIIGLLFLLVLGVAIAIIVLYMARRRQAEGKYSTGRKGNGKLHGLDNLVYGNSTRDIEIANTSLLEASTMYEEVPVTAVQSESGGGSTEHENAQTAGSTVSRAIPTVYGYATLEPNGMTEVNSEHYYSPLDETSISYTRLLDENKQEDIYYGNVKEYLEPGSGENELYAQIKACGIKNIPISFIQIQRHLGSGQFGSVEQGLWKNGVINIPVALKLLKEGSSELDKVKFLQEAAIMAQFSHPNVVSLYGVVCKTEPLILVVELIQKGDLRNYLHTMRPDPGELPAASMPNLLLNFSHQVALGMQYLSAKGFVHRDLAARNILVSKDNICKVADFGMSRDLADETYYVSQGGKIPVKWTAPEAIHYKKYSTASDVWSYGCLLYEIWSLGHKPFERVGNNKAIELVDCGKRLPPPPGCSRVLYELMIECWNPVAAHRPSFRKLFITLLDSPEEVLSVPTGMLGAHHLAGVLGSPLEAGESLYRDLQDRYLQVDDDYQVLY